MSKDFAGWKFQGRILTKHVQSWKDSSVSFSKLTPQPGQNCQRSFKSKNFHGSSEAGENLETLVSKDFAGWKFQGRILTKHVEAGPVSPPRSTTHVHAQQPGSAATTEKRIPYFFQTFPNLKSHFFQTPMVAANTRPGKGRACCCCSCYNHNNNTHVLARFGKSSNALLCVPTGRRLQLERLVPYSARKSTQTRSSCFCPSENPRMSPTMTYIFVSKTGPFVVLVLAGIPANSGLYPAKRGEIILWYTNTVFVFAPMTRSVFGIVRMLLATPPPPPEPERKSRKKWI